jgi:hypothetical protein
MSFTTRYASPHEIPGQARDDDLRTEGKVRGSVTPHRVRVDGAQRPGLAGLEHRLAAPAPGDPAAAEAVTDWLRHVESGRIGSNPPVAADVLALRLRNEAVVLGRSK